MKFCMLPIDVRANKNVDWGGNLIRQSVGNAPSLVYGLRAIGRQYSQPTSLVFIDRPEHNFVYCLSISGSMKVQTREAIRAGYWKAIASCPQAAYLDCLIAFSDCLSQFNYFIVCKGL